MKSNSFREVADKFRPYLQPKHSRAERFHFSEGRTAGDATSEHKRLSWEVNCTHDVTNVRYVDLRSERTRLSSPSLTWTSLRLVSYN